MTDHNQPTSDWEHSHALTGGEKLVDTTYGTEMAVTQVRDDGSVTVRFLDSDVRGEKWETETHTEEEIRVALRDGVYETPDGKSHELAAF